VADIFRIEVEGAGPVAAKFSRAQRRLQDSIIQEFRPLGRRLQAIYLAHAPSDRGFEGGIRSRLHAAVNFVTAGKPTITVRTTARDSESGYAYLNVTRFGHRKLVIFPKHAKALAVRYAGHRNPHIIAWRPYVEGYHPDSDWVEDASLEAEGDVAAAELRLGRRVEVITR
jgi:hypothetical protein